MVKFLKYWQIFVFILVLGVFSYVKAETSLIISTTPADSAKVGEEIKIDIKVYDCPTDLAIVILEIESPYGEKSYKSQYNCPGYGKDTTEHYIWKTQDASSTHGRYFIIASVKSVASGQILKEEKKEYRLLSNNTTPGDETGTDEEDSGFNLDKIGTYTPPSYNSDLEGKLKKILNEFILILSGLAVLAVIYSGIMYIVSAGDAQKAESAKKNLIWAIIGVFLVLGSLIIVNLINYIIEKGSV